MTDDDVGPLRTGDGIEPIADGVWVLHGQGQSLVCDLGGRLIVVDAGPGGRTTAKMIAALRGVTRAPVEAIVYSHGHLGYNAGVPQWFADAEAQVQPPPRLIAQRRLRARHSRYRETAELQARLAETQFRRPPGSFRVEMHEPTEWFDEHLDLGSGTRRVELRSAPSETDDAVAVWCPGPRVLYGGPALLDSIPNVGTPLRTLRDPVRWAETLDGFRALQPEIIVREFGPPLRGTAAIDEVLTATSEALRWLRAETVRLMNAGLGEAQILATLVYPPRLFERPWMRPIYGDPSYIVRDIYRSENGWWDRNPTSLHPAAPAAVAAAIGGAIVDQRAVLAAAERHAAAGDTQLALHVVDLLANAAGETAEIAEARRLKAEWLRRRAREVRSYVSRSLLLAGADALEGRPTSLSGPVPCSQAATAADDAGPRARHGDLE